VKFQHKVTYLGATLLFASAILAACGGSNTSGTAGAPAVPNAGMQQQSSGVRTADGEVNAGVQESNIRNAAVPAPFSFSLVVSAGAKTCLPNAHGSASISSLGPQAEKLHVSFTGLPPNTDFDFFVIQVPTAPFGLSWYQGDIETGSRGTAAGDFVGRFSNETFIVAPGVAPAPVIFNGPFPDASSNPQTAPVHQYHLGLWFNSPNDAKKAGCAATVTPFNGEHDAGIQVLNTSNFPALAGPLLRFHS
jgi:hypothetical protein